MLTRNIRRLMLLVMMCCGMAVTNAQTSYNLSVTSEGGGTISYMTPTASGMVNANESNVFTVYEGEELQLTFTPSNDAYKLVAATVNGTNVMGDMTGNTYTISSVSGDITVYGGFDIAIKDGTVLTEVIDGIEWTYTVTDEANKRCQLGGVDSLSNRITAVPTSTVAENLAIPSVINGYTVYGLCVQAFYGCSGLTGQLNIPETVTFIGDQTFQGTNFSGTLTLPSGLNNLCSYSFYNLYNLTGDLVIPESLTVLPAYAFFNCQGFTSLTLPAGVTNLWTRCFGQMYGLKQITCYATTPPTIGAENVFSDYTIPLFVPAESVDAYKAATYWSNFTNIYAIGTELNHTLTVASSGGGKFVGAIKNLTGEIYSEFESNPDSDDPVEFPVTVPVGYSVEMTFTPNTGYYLYRVMKNDMEEISGQMVDNKLTLTDVNEDMKVSAEFLRTQLLLQVNSQTTYGTTNWEVTDVLGGGTVTSGTVQNEVQDVPVFYGSTVKVTFTYDQTQYGISQLLRGTTDILDSLATDGSYTITNYAAIDTITVNYAELATEAYAAVNADNNTLTFYYDKQKTARYGMSIEPFASAQQRPWWPSSKNFTNVVFDVSFSDYYPSSTAHWFYEFENLTSITGIEYLKTENVTDMTCMFWGCYALSSLDVSGFNTSNVTSMDHLFTHCSSLTSLDLTNFNTEKVTNMESMFWNCSSLTTLDLSNFNTSNVTNVSSMFADCSSLTTIYVGSGWSMENVTSGDAPFNGCTSLVGGKGTVYDSNLVNYAYAHIDGGPSNPGYFTDINAPTSYDITLKVEGWGTLTAGETNVTIGSEQIVTAATGSSMILAFTPDAGYRLATVMVDSTDVTSLVIADSTGVSYYTLTGIYDAHTVTATFVNDTKEAYAALTDDDTVVTFYYDTHRGDRGVVVDIYFNNYPSATTAIFDASFADYLPTSTNSWFRYCSSLTSVTGIQYLKTDNVTDMSMMFLGCSSLTSLDLSSFNTANVTNMHAMFYECSSLTSIDLSGFNTANVTDMTYMFFRCNGLTSLDLSSFNTANVTSMSHMFYNCSSLTSLDLSTFNTANVQSMSTMFSECSSLANINLTGTFSTDKVTDMGDMFNDCSSLTTLDLSNFSTGFVNNMYLMFHNCSNLQTIIVGSNWSTENLTNGDQMFTGCNSLVGGKGTSFAETSNTDVNFFTTSNYAHIDGGPSNPGYLTDINAPTSYPVTIKAVGHGTVTAGDATVVSGSEQNVDVATGSSMILAFTPDAGYRLATVMVDSTDVTSQVIADSTGVSYYTLTGIYDAHTVTATFEAIPVVAAPTLSRDGRFFTLNTETEGATIYYGVQDGVDATTAPAYQVYSATDIHLLDGASTIFAYAAKDDYISSDEVAWSVTLAQMTVAEPGGFAFADTVVTIATIPDSSIVRYTIDGTDPTETSTIYTAAGIPTTYNVTVKAIATRDNWFSSPVVSFTVDAFACQPVSFSREYFRLTMTTPTEDAGILYAVIRNDTTTPTFQPYEGPVLLNGDCTVQAYATRWGYNDSEITTYTFSNDDVNVPLTMSRVGNIITLTAEVDSIWYNFNASGSVPTRLTGIRYTEPFAMPASGNLNASVIIDGMVATYEYWYINLESLESPTFAWSGDQLSMTCATDSASIYYMLTETDGTDNGYQLYTAPIELTRDVTITAVARKEGVTDSDPTVLVYPYIAWQQLLSAVTTGETVLNNVLANPRITEDMKNQMTALIAEAQNMYAERTAAEASITVKTTEINDYAAELQRINDQVREAYAALSGDNSTLTFYYDYGKENRNGMAVGTFANENENPWYTYRASITTVVFDESFASFTELTSTAFWFNNFGSLTTITGISNLKTDNVTDMKFMFNSCSGLTSLDLSSFNTGNVTDMSSMFLNCSGLTSLNLSSFNTSNVTNMRYMFNGCSGLTTLDLSSFNTANVTDMGYMFSYCSGLTSLDLSNFNTANVMYMPEMFSSCSSLASLDLSNFNTSNVTGMHSMFYNCSSLTTLDVSSFSTANVTDMSNMFQACSSLTSLDLSSFNTANVTTMYFMLSNCSNLTTIYVGEGWSTENVTQSGGMFNDCTALVGYMGTTYDVNNIGASYAHIDGGTDNPGYFSRKLQKGDANGDGEVNIADAVAAVAYILATGEGYFSTDMADMNDDSEIDIFDVTMIVNAALAANTTGGSRDMAVASNIDRIAAEDVMLTAKSNCIFVDIDRTGQFTAFQFDVTLPAGTELVDVKLGTSATDHQLSFVKRGDGQYRVVGLSMSNEVVNAAISGLIQLQVSDPAAAGSVQVSNVLFVNPQGKDAMGISRPTVGAAQEGYYDLNGRYMGTDRRQLSKGMYIRNHKKVIVK